MGQRRLVGLTAHARIPCFGGDMRGKRTGSKSDHVTLQGTVLSNVYTTFLMYQIHHFTSYTRLEVSPSGSLLTQPGGTQSLLASSISKRKRNDKSSVILAL